MLYRLKSDHTVTCYIPGPDPAWEPVPVPAPGPEMPWKSCVITERGIPDGWNVDRPSGKQPKDFLQDELNKIGRRAIDRQAANQNGPKINDLTAKVEQLRVQLAGCGVAAMQDTEESRKERAKEGDYGWSASYGDVCRQMDKLIEARKELAIETKSYEIVAKDRYNVMVELEGKTREVKKLQNEIASWTKSYKNLAEDRYAVLEQLEAASRECGTLKDEIACWTEKHTAVVEDNSAFLRRLGAMSKECGQLKSDYERACQTIAQMHAAAVGEATGPKRGVVEDVEAVRRERDALLEHTANALDEYWRCKTSAQRDAEFSNPMEGL